MVDLFIKFVQELTRGPALFEDEVLPCWHPIYKYTFVLYG